jgi:dolichol-phosphate mannosyltransferase
MVIPTYNEVENIPLIIERIFEVYKKNDILGEVIVVDDDSKDGTGKAAKKMAKKYDVKVIVRKKDRGLSSAVLRGFDEAKYDILGVIDADLSHPPEVIPKMLKPIQKGEMDFTLGSRYIKGGGMKDWPLKRKMISKGATMMAAPLTRIKDPMSGYMMVRRDKLEGADLNPKGYKIALEILVKCKITRFKEVPIIFKDRELGESKLNWKEQINYLVHLNRLYKFKYKTLYQFILFCIIGGLGFIVDLAVFSLYMYVFDFKDLDLGFIFKGYIFAQTISFIIAVTHNFFWNKYLTFREAEGNPGAQYVKFFIVAVIAFVLRTILLYLIVDYGGLHEVISLMIVIIIVTVVNFVGSKLWAFGEKSKNK